MKYLHTMIRVNDLEVALDFFVDKLGMKEVERKDVPEGKFTLIFLAGKHDDPPLELTYNWDNSETYISGRSFGHVAYGVENIYDFCKKIKAKGVAILRPPRDGRMAFIRSPDQISIEILQIGDALPIQEPWASMPNQGEW